MSTQKYRPYLTLNELVILTDAISGIEKYQALHRYLTKYVRDIKDGFRRANHTLAPTIEEKLELVSAERCEADRYAANEMTTEEEINYEIRVGIRTI